MKKLQNQNKNNKIKMNNKINKLNNMMIINKMKKNHPENNKCL